MEELPASAGQLSSRPLGSGVRVMLDQSIELLVFTVFLLIGAATLLDLPQIFRIPVLRPLYRKGIPLYKCSFSVQLAEGRTTLLRWQVEHWSATSTLLWSFAEQDGDLRVVMMEMPRVGIYRSFFPGLMRAVIVVHTTDSTVTIRGLPTFTAIFLTSTLILLLWAAAEAGNSFDCLLLLTVPCALMWGTTYAIQATRFRRLGIKVARYFSGEDV